LIHIISGAKYKERFPGAEIVSKDWKKRQTASHLGQEAWNQGLTKETDCRVRKQSNTQKEIEFTSEHCQHISDAKKGQPNSIAGWNKGLTKETSEIVARVASNTERNKAIGLAAKERMNDPEYVSKLHQKMKREQTKPEIIMECLLDAYFKDQWKFVGNGQVVVDGMVPDFININGKKQVIEVYGDYWHKDHNPQDRINRYKEFGFNCLVYWEKDLKDLSPEIVDIIKSDIEELPAHV
jgi:G:T-mismatch repair DNA endonuclease (very short patch repair protein)